MRASPFEILDRWLTGMRVGLAAYRLSLSRPGGPDTPFFRRDLREALRQDLQHLGALDAEDRLKRFILASLPVQSLQTLMNPVLESRLAEDPLAGEVPHWRAAFRFVTQSQKEGRPPLVNASKLIAQLVLEGYCDPYFLIQCGRVFVNDAWSQAARGDTWKDSASAPLSKLWSGNFIQRGGDRYICTN